MIVKRPWFKTEPGRHTDSGPPRPADTEAVWEDRVCFRLDLSQTFLQNKSGW